MDVKKPANHKSYRTKCDEIFMKPYRGLPCEICGSTKGTCFHHNIGKNISKALRFDPKCGTVLCPSHHKFSNEIAPHSTSVFAVGAYRDWFRENRPEQYKWLEENKYIERKYNYRDALENLKNGREAWE